MTSRLVYSIILLSFITLYTSCNSISIIDVYKEKHIPGIPNLDNYLIYTLQFKTKKTFTLNKLTLYTDAGEIPVSSYSFIDLQDHNGQTIQDKDKEFEKGNYKITFRIDSDATFLYKEQISIEYMVDQNSKKKKKSIAVREKVVKDR